jgi:hypothetical protein
VPSRVDVALYLCTLPHVSHLLTVLGAGAAVLVQNVRIAVIAEWQACAMIGCLHRIHLLSLGYCRLYLASDMLHNSTVPVRNASRYRQLLQAELPAVFQSFHEALLSAEAALKREAFKRNSLRVLRVWRDWYLFSEEYLNGLQATFLMDTDRKWRGLCAEQMQA